MANRLEVLFGGDARELNDVFGSIDRSVEKMTGNIQSKAQDAALALGALAAGGAALTSTFLSKASEMQQFEARLTAITGNSKSAQTELKKLSDFAAKTPFELPGVVEAGIRLRSLGADVDKFLPVAGNLAAGLGRDLPESATILAKALKGLPDALTQLRDAGVASKSELEALGVKFTSSGGVAEASIGKLQEALDKIIKNKFGDQMALQSKTFGGAVSNMKDSLGQLAAELGKTLIPMGTSIAKAIGETVDSFRALPDSTKGVIADLVLVTTVVSGAAAAALGLAAVLGPAALAWVTYAGMAQAAAVAQAEAAAAAVAATAAEGGLALAAQTAALAQGNLALASGAAATGMTGVGAAGSAAAIGLGPVLLVVAALAGGFAYYINQMGKANQAAEETLKQQEKLTVSFGKSKGAVIDAAEALKYYGSATSQAADMAAEASKKRGLTDVDIHRSIVVLSQERDRLITEGNQKQADAIEKRLEIMRAEIPLLSGLFSAREAEKAAAISAEKAKQEAIQSTLEVFKKNKSAGVFANPKEELAAMDAVLAVLAKGSKDAQELMLDRVKLSRDVEEKGRKDQLDAAMHQIDMLGAARNVDKQAQLNSYKEILAGYKLTADERRRIELDIAKLSTDIAKDTEAKEKKRAEDAKKAAADVLKAKQAEMDSEIRLNEAKKSAKDSDVSSLEARLKRGEDVLGQLEKEIVKRAQLAAKIVEEKAAKEALGKSEADASSIREAGAIAAANERKKASEKVAELERDQAAKKDRESQAALELDGKIAKAREAQAMKELEATGKGGAKALETLKERQRLEEESLRKKASVDSKDKDAADSARIQKELELELINLKARQTEEQDKLNDSIEETKNKLKDLKKQTEDDFGGGVNAQGQLKTVAEVFGTSNSRMTGGSIYAEDTPATTKTDARAAANSRATSDALGNIGKPRGAVDGAFVGEGVAGTLERIATTLEAIRTTPVKVDMRGGKQQTTADNDSAFKLNKSPGLSR